MKFRSSRIFALAMTCLMSLPYAYGNEADNAMAVSLFSADTGLYKKASVVNGTSSNAASSPDKIGDYQIISIESKPTLAINQLHQNSLNPAIFDPIDEQTYQQDFNNLVGGSASYFKGRFAAETGIVEQHSSQAVAQEFFIQGSYAFIQREKFNMQVVAKVAAVEQDNAFAYSFNNRGNSSVLESNDTKATWGIIGSYSLTPQWAIVGAFTSTAKDIEQSQILGQSDDHAARFGTTYSF